MALKGPPSRRKLPDDSDPLSEPTWGRRLWAASMRAGYQSRLSFARAIGITPAALDRWDRSEVTEIVPDLALFFRACQLVGYTAEEIWEGKKRDYGGRRIQTAKELEDFINDMLEQGLVSRDAVTAFSRHRANEGAYEVLTHGYVQAFLQYYDASIAKGNKPLAAAHDAFEAARMARAVDKGFEARITPRPKQGRPRRDDD